MLYRIDIPLHTPYVDHAVYLAMLRANFPGLTSSPLITCGGPTDTFITKFAQTDHLLIWINYLIVSGINFEYTCIA